MGVNNGIGVAILASVGVFVGPRVGVPVRVGVNVGAAGVEGVGVRVGSGPAQADTRTAKTTKPERADLMFMHVHCRTQ